MTDLSPPQERSVRLASELATLRMALQATLISHYHAHTCETVTDSVRSPCTCWKASIRRALQGERPELAYAEMVARVQDACVGDDE